MQNPHKRKKEPRLVRRNLLEHAAQIAADLGISAVTVQAVSAAAGVSKGGFMHHFPSKQALIDALFKELLDDTEIALNNRIEADSHKQGVFTRAYIDVVLNWDKTAERKHWATLAIFMLNDSKLRQIWANWFNAQIEKYKETDIHLSIIRLAVDGIWLSDFTETSFPNRAQIYQMLIQSTYNTSPIK